MAGISQTAINLLATMFSESDEFQDWASAADATALLAGNIHKVVRPVEPGEGESVWPFVVIGHGGGLTYDRIASGLRHQYTESGRLWVAVEALVDPGDSEAEAEFAFTDKTDQILDEVLLLSGLGGYLSIVSVTEELPPFRPSLDEVQSENRDVYCRGYTVAWGI